MWRKYEQTACIPVRNQTRIIQCPKRAVSEWKFVTNWDQFSDKLQSWDSASFIPNERSISEVHLSVVIFISTPSHTYYRATFEDLSKILWIHMNSHHAKRSREGHTRFCISCSLSLLCAGPWPLDCIVFLFKVRAIMLLSTQLIQWDAVRWKNSRCFKPACGGKSSTFWKWHCLRK